MENQAEKIEYSLKRGLRKTILLRVTPECKVEVLAPRRTSEAFIEGFVQSKRDWILKSIAAKEEIIKKRAAYQMDTLSFLGVEYPIKTAHGQEIAFDGSCFRLPRCAAAEQRALIKQWYRREGKEILLKRVQHWAEKMDAQYSAVKVTEARTRWGSCSGQNSLNFSWRLLFAAGKVVDYVVIHELAHTKVHAHSPEFWQVVAAYCPDYESCQQELKELADKLAVWDW